MPKPTLHLPTLANSADLLAFLRDGLNWPLPADALADELTFDWTGDDLRLTESASQRLRGGTVRQLRPLVLGQPLGIFLVEFADTQVYRTALRQILRGLVPTRRRDPTLQAWQHENLLFLCATADYERLTFAHFRGEQAGRARLATFAWRRGSSYLRTLLEHNLPKLAWPKDDGADSAGWLAQWARAFDKEPVTKKFFDDFNDTFKKVCHDIANRHARWSKETVEREAQTLLNRLLFLYFIQRKGWLNRHRDCLVARFRDHFRKDPHGTSYLNEFLRPLFVKLSTKGPQADLPGHDLPFLNGGLFSDEYGAEQRDDDVRRHHELKIGNDTFQHIFDDLLEAYNFTVREDTPLDVDVAIDPEMLGKIFESLVLQLEQSQVGGKSSRHDTGSHYTPRPYVHYLCRESLAAWLADQPFGVPPSGGPASAQSTPGPAKAGTPNDWPSRVHQLLALDAADGIDAAERATLDALLTPDEARTLADRLYDLRACDIAVGSGAFPVALLHELVNLARLCETRARGKDPVATDARWLFDTKTRFIERCLYGVDIQERAIEICKLRLWLALVVDYPLDVDVDSCERHSFRDALRKLPALPNLDFKIRRANSLVDMIRGEPVPLGRLHGGEQARLSLNHLISAKREFYSADSVPDKRRLCFEIYHALAELAQIELTAARNELGLIPDPANAEKVAELDKGQKEMAWVLAHVRDARKMKAADQDEALERLRARFDDEQKPTFVWQLDFAEVFHRFGVPPSGGSFGVPALAGSAPDESNPLGIAHAGPPEGGTPNLSGFDLLVGNPPYVRIQVLNQAAPAQAAWFKAHYDAAKKGNYDLYVVFVERSLQLLQPRGQLAFILPHKFFNAQYGGPLRDLLARGKHLRHVVHFGDQQIFPGATNYVCLLFLAKAGADECRWVRADELPDWLATLRAPEAVLPAARLTVAEWNFAVGQASGLFDKLQRMPVKLGDVCSRMFQGSITSADSVFLFKEFKAARKGMIEGLSKELEKAAEIEAGILKRVVRSGSIGRYHAQPTALVLFPYAVKNNEARLFTPAEMQDRFPAAWDYLKQNRRLLEDREDASFKDKEWYRFGRSQNLGLWEQPKLMVPYMITELGVYLDISDSFYFINVTTGGYGITSADKRVSLPYLCGLLNSRLLDFYLKRVSTNFHGGYFAANKQFIEQLPIRPIDFASASERAEHDALVGLVERILSAKRAAPSACLSRDGRQADTSALEREIDARVYSLYALTPDELKLVEEASK